MEEVEPGIWSGSLVFKAADSLNCALVTSGLYEPFPFFNEKNIEYQHLIASL